MAEELYCVRNLFNKKPLENLDKINELPVDVIAKCLHGILDELCGINGRLGLRAALTYYGDRVQDRQALMACYRIFCSQAVRLNLSEEQIKDDLTKSKVDPMVVPVVANAILARQHTAQAAASRNTSQISKSYLTDFDWKVNLQLSNDRISSVRSVCTLLSLNIHNNESDADENVMLELNAEELDKLIAELQNVHRALIQLKT